MIFKKIFCVLFALFGEPGGLVERVKVETSERNEYEESEGHTPYADLHSSSSVYAKRFAGPVGEYFLLKQGNILQSCVPDQQRLRILDIGGGHAHAVNALLSRQYDLTVLGTGPDVPAPIRSTVAAGQVRYIAGPLDAVPCEDGAFDICICLRQLSHMIEPDALIQEMCRVASRGVIVDFAPFESFNVFYPMLFQVKKRLERTTRKFTVFDTAEVVRAFSRNGFHCSQVHRQYVLPMGFHRALRRPRVTHYIESVFEWLGITRRFGSPVILYALRNAEFKQ